MDLQTERRLEKFLQLSALPTVRIDSRMEFHIPPLHFYIEYINSRVIFTLSRPVECVDRAVTFRTLLGLCHPARTQGIPLRAYRVGEQFFLSFSPAPEHDVRHWLACHRTMQRLLETHLGGAQ